nr:histone deacetylase [Pedobacter xinjiangensis]
MIKYELIPEQLLYEGLITEDNLFSPELVDEEIITSTHDEEYWERLRNLRLTEKEIRRSGFPLSEKLVEREMRIVRGTIDGCLFALKYGVAFNVAGGTHHAGTNWAEGFCLLNDQAIAANYLIESKLSSRILIIDLDVHQGNGTAQIFEHNSDVFTFSMHAENNFPFRKERSDWDIGLPNNTGDTEYLDVLRKSLLSLFEKVKPDFVFYLSGVDVLHTDKIGHLSLSKEACKERDRLIFEHCKKFKVPVQVSMGGGYSARISDIVEAHCNTFRVAYSTYY